MYESIAMLIVTVVSFLIAFVCYVKLCFEQADNKILRERNVQLNKTLNENHLRTIVLEKKEQRHLEIISKLRSQSVSFSKEIEDLLSENTMLKQHLTDGEKMAEELVDKIDKLVSGA